MAFISNPDGDLKNAFISDSWLLDQFVGNTLFTWGYSGYGRLGNNNITNISNPIQTIALGTNWKQVTCGYTNTAAIKTDGTLWGFGYNIYGQLGDNTITNKSSPVQTVAFGINWKQVSCGYTNTAAIKTDGTLWVFGYNIYGQLGDNTRTNRSSPVQTVAFGTNWKQVACGYTSTVAIKTDGTLWTWGYNGYGQLGDNTIINRSSPVQTVAGGTNWKQVASGYLTTAAIKTDGTLWVWGKGIYGQLGDNAIVSRSSPVQTIAYGTNWKQVVCSNHTAAIKTDGTLWTWGFNSYGQLGDNTIIRKSSPVQTSAGGTNWKQINCGYLYTAATTNGDM
jgi:alpha-tubulin suppressor-like RCC1 family protein